MKKLIASILAVLYLCTSTGATVYMHYCMGELAGWSLGLNESTTCGGCGMEKSNENKKGCCKDEHKFIKDNSDQKVVESSFQLVKAMVATRLPGCSELPPIQIISISEKNPVGNAPPRSNGIAVYILKRTFLI